MTGTKGRSGAGVNLTEPEVHILLSMAEGGRHGYRMMHEARERTGGRVAMGAGTLYGALKRLRTRGLIEESDERHEPPTHRGRRYYRITESGIKTLVYEIDYMRNVIRTYHAIVEAGA